MGASFFDFERFLMTLYCKGAISLEKKKRLCLLAIGNSFSEDATRWLCELAHAAGVEEVCLGNLYIGGCTLERHAANAKTGAADYLYMKNTGAGWTSRPASLLDGLTEEAWDIITLQQASGYSGIAETYNADLDALIAFVSAHKKNPDARLYWHMTWAYEGGSDHPDFAKYGRNQRQMYAAILSAVEEKICPRPEFSGVIPVGTTIQNLRNLVGDRLTRDGYHLSLGLGRYAAAMTWLHTLTGEEVEPILWTPEEEPISADELAAVKRAVLAAARSPFADDFSKNEK